MNRFLHLVVAALLAVGGLDAQAGLPATCPAISIAPANLPDGDFANAYTPVVTSSNGTAPVTVEVTSGVLPNGVSLTDNGDGTATFSGTATQSGTFEITITATDVDGCSGGRTYAPTFSAAGSNTSLALTAGPNPAAFGQSLTFTATVTSTSGTPTGTVTFKDGAATLGTGTLDGSGQATFTTTTLGVGTHAQITAAYAGDGSFGASTSNALSQTDNQATTTTTLVSSASPSVFGQSVTFTATVAAVAPGAGTPTGTVTFTDGVTSLGTGTLDGGGLATLTTGTLPVGAHSITATYGADIDFTGSSSSPFSQTVNQATTTTTVVSTTNPSVFGQSVTFTATVAASAPGAGTPTGTVTFLDGASSIGTGTLNGSGQATFTTSTLAIGSHSITASYAADTNFSASTSTALSQSVNQAATTTALISSLNPSSTNQPVTVTATVTATAPGVGTPTGTVTFLDGTTTLGSGTLNGSGQATLTTSTLAAGSHSITAAFGGDSNFTGSTSAPLTQTVNLNASATTLTSSINPTVFGQSATFTATVTSGAGTPTGTVAFMDGATLLGSGTLVAGVTTFSTGTLAIGAHAITAIYSGDSSFSASTSAPLTQTVNQAATTTTVGSSVNPSVFGQSVTLTATVAAVAPGAGTPTGAVTFKDGAVVLGTPVALNGSGQAAFTSSAFTVGAHQITATYSADTNFLASDNTASPLTQTVNQAATTTTVTSGTNPSVFGQSVTFTATVTAVAPGAGTPTGTVTFKDGAAIIGAAVAVNGSGQAVFATSTLTVSTHSITATYNADANFTTSASSAVSQLVNQAATTTTVASSLNPSVFGQSVTFTATVSAVAPGAGTPTSSVTFKDGATTLGSVALAGGVATLATSTLSVGSHSITATYGADANFSGSTSSPLSQTVNKVATTTSVVSNLNPSVFQNSVTFTATVTHSGSGTATGSVNFLDGATSIGSGTLSGTETAVLTVSTLTGGTHSITAVYGGDASFATSTSGALSQVVQKANQTITFSSTPPAFGATVAPNHTYDVAATASSGLAVSFTIDSASTSVCSIASATVTFNAAGTCTVDANQPGDGNWNAAAQVQQSVTVLAPANAVADTHAVTGNVPISSTSSVTTNDTGTNIAIVSYGATGNEQAVLGSPTPTAQGGSVTLVGTGLYSFTPKSNFTGTDTFKYVINNGLNRPSTGTVTLNVTDRIMIVSTGGGGTCDPVTPSPCTLAIADAAVLASGKDLVFVESGTYGSAAFSLLAAQNLVGQQISLAQAITDIGGITLAPDSLALATIAANARPVFNNSGNVVTLGGSNLVEYFNINATGGSAILGSGIASGTSTVHDLTITGTGGAIGVNLTANSGATFNFSNLATTTATGMAFSATGGGTVNVTTPSGASTLAAGAATALNVSNTNIGSAGLTFQSISSNGGTNNGIVLDTTGNSGGLTVTGDGADVSLGGNGSGGTIANKSGADGSAAQGIGIYLNSTNNVVLRRMVVNGANQNFGIRGITVSGFTLEYSTVAGSNGTSVALDEGSVIFDGLTGTSVLTSDNISGSIEDNFRIRNSSGTSDVTLTTSTVSNAPNDNVIIEPSGTSAVTAHVTNNTFTGAGGDHIQTATTNSATLTVVITGNAYSNGFAGSLGGGITISGGNAGSFEHVNFNVSNNGTAGNPLVGTVQGGAININEGNGAGVWQGQVSNNFIGNAAVANSGAAQSSAIRVENHSPNGTLTAIVNANSIKQWNNGPAINSQGGDAGNATNAGIVNLTVTNNTASNPGTSSQHGYVANMGASNAAADTYSACVDVRANTLDGNVANGGSGVRLRQRGSSTIKLPGYTGAQFDTTAVVSFETLQNPASTPAPTATTSGAGGGFQNAGAQCAQPVVPN